MSRPSLLFINQHYWPDHAATGQYLTDLAEYLAAEGHDVHVLCSRGRYLSGKMDVPRREVRAGVSIHRVGATSFGRQTHAGRLADYASFYAQAMAHTLRHRYDYVITLTTPPLLCVMGTLLRRLKGQRYGIWSMDLHPDAEVAVGWLKNDQWLTRLLHALNNAGYRNAEFVVALGRYMKQRIVGKGTSEDRLRVIPVWGWKDDVYPVAREDNPLYDGLGLRDKFIVMYSGNAGLGHCFDEVLAAMRALRDHPSIHFLFAGGGPRRKEIEEYARRHAITNFDYLDYFPREQLHHSLSLGDVHLLTLRPEMAGIAAPSKLYGAMAAGRPVIMIGPEASEPGETIMRHTFGAVIPPGKNSAEKLKETVLHFHYSPADLAEMGARAREAFLSSYVEEIACEEWKELLVRR